MNFPDTLFPSSLYWLAQLVYFFALVLAVYTAPWRRIVKREQHNVFLGACVALLLIWNLKAGIHPGLNFHLLGGTLLTLMFGWQFAIIGASLILVGITINSSVGWLGFGLNGLMMVVLPVAVSSFVYLFAFRRLPHHFFIYTIFNGYFGGALAMFSNITLSTLLFITMGSYTLDFLEMKYLPFAPMMIFAEGFFTGMLVTSMALFRPEWLITYDDKRYIVGK